MKFSASIIAVVAAVLPAVSGHYVFSQLIVGGKNLGHYEYIRKNSNGFQPTKSALGPDFRCNTGSQAAASTTRTYKLAAGSEIGFKLAYGATIQHPGPMQVYMSKAPGQVSQYDGSGDWFKIYEVGPTAITPNGIQWGVTGKDTFTFKIPATTPPGQYLVRMEHIGVHRSHVKEPEFYFTCAQIEVTGSGGGKPGPLVKIPGVYTGNESGIWFNMYYPKPTKYTMPGPAVWRG